MNVITKITEWDNKLFKFGIAAFALFFITGVAIIDFNTGYKTAVSLLYLVPIILTAWFSWRPTAFLIAGLSGVSDSVVNIIMRKPYADINTLNSLTQFVFFGVFTYVLLELKKSQGILRKLSRTDSLTGLVNSGYFFEIGNGEIQRTLRYKHPFSVVYIDVDNFKTVNDTIGHSAGDALLRKIAENVRSTIRSTDTMARMGGDEFAILMPETNDKAAGSAIGRIQNSLLSINMPKGAQVTFSMGVFTGNECHSSFNEVIKAADKLMYAAKHSGKNKVSYGVVQ